MKKKSGKKKLWGGRFTGSTDALVEKFSASIDFDSRLYSQDIRGSIAHAKMLGEIGVYSKPEVQQVVRGLKKIEDEISNGLFQFDESCEDIHMNIEASLIERLGPVGAKLHTARSRNDQIALDLRLWLKDTIEILICNIAHLQNAFVFLAQSHCKTVFPGYTHLQLAQPVIFAHHLLAYVEMLERDKGRIKDCRERADELPLGTGALAGTSIPIDRKFVARELGFSRIASNSMDAVGDRDFLLEYLSALAILGVHFSRLAEELVLWTTYEFRYIEMEDAFCTGSSMLPQKKNPDVAELIRGKTGVFIGELVCLMTMMKGLPMCYNRDMQEDKLPVFKATDTAMAILNVLTPLIKSLKVREGKIRSNIKESSIQAIDLAEYLVCKGMPFRESHFIVGKIVRYAEEHGKPIGNLKTDELKSFSKLFSDDVIPVLDPLTSPERKTSDGGTSPDQVRKRVKLWRKKLDKEIG